MVRLINSQVSTSVKDGTGGGGNITIDPQFVILQNSQIIAQAFAGSGGAINVTAGVFLADPSSRVNASSQQGPQGTVNIQSPVQNLGEQLTPLSQQFSSAAALLAQRCAARVADGKFSTFVVAGREGLPVEPGGILASPSWTAELLRSTLSGLYPHRPMRSGRGLVPGVRRQAHPTGEVRGRMPPVTGPVCLVNLFCLVYLVDEVHLVYLVCPVGLACAIS